MGNPTDPDAGTNRTNAVSRDNLMNEAELGYDGNYSGNSLRSVGTNGEWNSSTTRDTRFLEFLYTNTDSYIYPQGDGSKYFGRAVR